jgi:hypothetical protein
MRSDEEGGRHMGQDTSRRSLPVSPTVRLGKIPVEDPDDDLLFVDRTVAT